MSKEEKMYYDTLSQKTHIIGACTGVLELNFCTQYCLHLFSHTSADNTGHIGKCKTLPSIEHNTFLNAKADLKNKKVKL